MRKKPVKNKEWEEEEEFEEEEDEETEEDGEDVEDEEELSNYEQLQEILDDFEDGIHELSDEAQADLELILDILFSQHQVLVRVNEVFSQMSKKELRPIKHYDRPLIEDVETAILGELSPFVCEECGVYTERCLCGMMDEDEDIDDDTDDDADE